MVILLKCDWDWLSSAYRVISAENYLKSPLLPSLLPFPPQTEKAVITSINKNRNVCNFFWGDAFWRFLSLNFLLEATCILHTNTWILKFKKAFIFILKKWFLLSLCIETFQIFFWRKPSWDTAPNHYPVHEGYGRKLMADVSLLYYILHLPETLTSEQFPFPILYFSWYILNSKWFQWQWYCFILKIL